jgi:hypothetical protein
MRNNVSPALTSEPSTNSRFSTIPSTRARTCAVRQASSRPGASWVRVTAVGWTVMTSTSAGGIVAPGGWPSPGPPQPTRNSVSGTVILEKRDRRFMG